MSSRPAVRGVLASAVVGLLVGATACAAAAPPGGQSRANELAAEIASMPGVRSAGADVTDRIEAGDPHVWLSVGVADDATPEQVTDVVARYLDGVRAPDFSGHLTELDVHATDDRFAIDGGLRPLTNADEVGAQAAAWVVLRRALPGAAVDVRASIVMPEGLGHKLIGRIDLPDPAGASEVAATVTTLSGNPRMGGGSWSVYGSTAHPSSVTAVGRLPNAQEVGVFTALDADQTVPHVTALYVNAPQTPPVWLSESVPSHDPAMRFDLAGRHLPMVAALPGPVFYTATDQTQGLRDFFGRATAPVAVTIGGCTTRTYVISPAERDLVNRYERCPHP